MLGGGQNGVWDDGQARPCMGQCMGVVHGCMGGGEGVVVMLILRWERLSKKEKGGRWREGTT